jgi:chemotaxis protein CheX
MSEEYLREGLLQISESVWGHTLLLPFQPEEVQLPEGPALVGHVRITGAWTGALSIWCSEAGARDVASAMFGREPGALADDDLRDAVGELANMIGGNLKVLLPPPTRLSLPEVRDEVWRSEPAEARVTFLSGDHPVRVSVARAA